MPEPTIIELQRVLPPEVYARLQAEAERQQTALTQVVREAIEEYLNNRDEGIDATPDKDIETGFLQGWHEVMTGQTRPARVVLEELRKVPPHDRSS